MKWSLSHLPILSWAILAVVLFVGGCVEEAPFFPADDSKLTVVALQVDNTTVEEGRVGIKVDAAFTLIFSSPVDPDLAQEALSISSPSGTASLNVAFNNNGSILAITPVDSLAFEELYTVRVDAGALGTNGAALEVPFELTFTTEIEPKPLFASGTGSETDPYVIDAPEQFDLIRLFLESSFVLAADIDLTELSAADPLGWSPLGDLIEGFSGVIDGAGFTVSGVSISRPDQTEVGLFGVLAGGTLRNLTVEVVGVEGNQATGALVGRQLDGLIENCHSSGSVRTTSSRAGGLVGSQEAGLITRSSSSCGVFGTASRIGGLVGLSQAGTVSESFSSGNCESLSSRVGGVVGSLESDATVADCYATGNMTGKNRVGGIAGRLDGTYNRGYATGNITVTDADDSGDYPGNVAGQLGSSSSFSELYYPADQTINYGGNADITTDGFPINIGAYTCSTPTTPFSGFDFGTTWTCAADGQWPLLSWQ